MTSRAYIPAAKTDDWATPPELFATLDAEFHFSLDAAASRSNAKCPVFFTRRLDGLRQDWGEHRVWLNPPYGRPLHEWMRKALESSRAGATVVCLVPARTCTRWWHEYVLGGGAEIRFLRGRLRFGGAKNAAPFPSVVVVFRPPVARARAA